MTYTPAGWLALTELRARWSNCPAADPLAEQLLTAARDQVLEYAPVLADGDPIPARYIIAQGLQARAIWEASKANVSPDTDAVGMDGYQVRVYSLAKPVRDLLRPPTTPKVG